MEISHEVAVRCVLGLRSSESLIGAGGSISTYVAGMLVLAVGRGPQFTFTRAFPQDLLSVPMPWLPAFPRVRYLRPRYNGNAWPGFGSHTLSLLYFILTQCRRGPHKGVTTGRWLSVGAILEADNLILQGSAVFYCVTDTKYRILKHRIFKNHTVHIDVNIVFSKETFVKMTPLLLR